MTFLRAILISCALVAQLGAQTAKTKQVAVNPSNVLVNPTAAEFYAANPPTGGGGSGTVTSVAASGGSTGLSFSGSPITTSGTLTLSGTLAVANGGTGVTSASLVAGTGISISGTWPNQTVTASGSGTVTSVALTLPDIFSVTGSPVTTSGTLAGSLAVQSANTVFAGPTSGGAAAPTFRALASSELSDTANIARFDQANAFPTQTGTQIGPQFSLIAPDAATTNLYIADSSVDITFPSTSGTLALASDLAGYQPLAAPLTALSGGSSFVQFTGPSVSTKTFTLPNSSSTLLYSGGPLGTPSSATLTSATGLPLSTGVTGVLPAANGGAGTVSGLLKANGSGTVSAATAGTDYLAVSGAAAQTITQALGANTAGTGELLTNTTAATSGNQQYSPATVWTGQGWKTASTAASQAVAFRAYTVPVQGSTAPTGLWTLESSINGGAYANSMTFRSDGYASFSGLLSPSYLWAPSGGMSFVGIGGSDGSAGLLVGMSTRATNFGGSLGLIDTKGVVLGSELMFGWSAQTGSGKNIETSESNDTAIARSSAGLVEVNNGTAGTYRDLRVRSLYTSTKTPSSASDTGTAGEIAWDSSYLYVCTATNTWKRVAISTW